VAIITAVSKPKVWSVPLMSFDGLGNAHRVDAVLGEVERDGLSIVATERDERVDLVELENFLHLLDTAGDLLHVGSRGVEDGAALELNAVDVFEGERDELVVEYAAPAIEESDEFVTVGLNSFAHCRIDDSIQAGAVSAAGQ